MRSLVSVVLVVTAGVLPGFLTGALGVQVRDEFGVGEAALGLSIGVFFGAAALTSAMLGRTAERLGPHRSMRVSGSMSASVLLAVAVAAQSFPVLLVMLAAAGAANALAQPAANVFVARSFPPARLGIAFAVKQSGVPAATMIGGLFVPTIALTAGWRWAYVAGAVIAIVGVALTPRLAPAARVAVRERPPRQPLALGSLSVLAVGIGFGAASAGTLGAFLTNAAVAAGVSEGAAGLLISIGSAIGIATRLAAGARADRRGHGHLLRVSVMLALGALAYFAYATQVPIVIVIATPLAFGAGWGWPGLFNLAVVRANPDAPGIASGITQTGTYLGAVIGPVLFGAVAEKWSYAAAWIVAGVLALAGAVVIGAGRVLVRRDRTRMEMAAAEADAVAACAEPVL